MRQLVRQARRYVRRAREVERFVRLIVGGGVALVAGLWVGTLSVTWSLPWLVGIGLTLVGVVTLAGGLRSQIEYRELR